MDFDCLPSYSSLIFFLKVNTTFFHSNFLVKSQLYYVNENTPSGTPDGSLQNPFTSLTNAYQALGPITCELILLGTSISLNSQLTFATGSNYIIRSDIILFAINLL